MLDAIITIFSFYGLTWAIKESDLLSRPRNWIMRNSVFMFGLLSCYFCTGFHAGWIIYLLHEQKWYWNFFILWGLASASISFILNIIINWLTATKLN